MCALDTVTNRTLELRLALLTLIVRKMDKSRQYVARDVFSWIDRFLNEKMANFLINRRFDISGFRRLDRLTSQMSKTTTHVKKCFL